MKDLTSAFTTKRNLKHVKKTKRKVELFQLGQSEDLLTWTDLGRPGTATHIYCTCEHLGNLYVGTAEAGSTGKVYLYVSSGNFTDCGRPGNATHIYDLLSVGGYLFAAVAVTGSTAAARVFRWNGGTSWTDTGLFQDPSSRVEVIGVHDGSMYAGVSAVQCKMWKFASMGSWIDCGNVGTTGVSRIMSMLSFSGSLYVGTGTTAYTFKYTAPTTWTDSGRCGVEAFISDLKEHNGNMYAATAQNGKVYRFVSGTTWTDYGQLGTQTWVYCLCEYESELYAGTGKTTSYYPYVYKYMSLNSWSQQGNLTPSGLTGENVLDIVVFDDYLYAGSGGGTGNGHLWTTKVPRDDISDYIEKGGIGIITKSTEQNLNEFIPSDISIVCKESNSDVFFKSDKTGLFDPDELSKGYRLKISSGLSDVDQWVTVFDGKVDPDSCKRNIREQVVFSAMGWLDNLKNYNAELVADPDNFPFKNITGITVSTIEDGTQTGAKTMEFGIESDGTKWLIFDGGVKRTVTGDGDVWLWDSVKESSMLVTVDYSELPSTDQDDSFTIIIHSGNFLACGWWENIKLSDLVGKLFDEGDITDQDIQVSDIENKIMEEKNFICLENSTLPRGTISAFRVVEINGSFVKCLLGMNTDDNCLIYLLTIAYSAQSFISSEKLSIGSQYRVNRFFKFGSKWWANIEGKGSMGYVSSDPNSYKAYFLKNFDSNYDIDYEYSFSENVYSRSGSVLGSTSNDIYYLYQDDTTSPPLTYEVKLGKLTWNGSALSFTTIKTLESNDGTNDDCEADAYASLIPENTENFYYYGIRKRTSLTDLDIMKYALTSDTFTTVLQDTSITGYIENFTRSTCGASYRWQGYFIYQKSATLDKAYWINDVGTLYEETNEEKIKNLIYGNPDFKNHYVWWHYEEEYYRIKSMHGCIGMEKLETEKLDTKYLIGDVAPDIFKLDSTTEYWYVGVVMGNDQHIVPFLYMPGKTPIIEVANFKDQTVFQALKELAIAYCCVFDIYEYQKGRFYFRESFVDSTTLDTDEHNLQPLIEYWQHWCDGVVVENSDKDILFRYGGTGYGKRKVEIDNRFISSRGMAKVIAYILFNFFNQRKLLITVSVPFWIEMELFDKITITLRDKDDGSWRVIDTLVYSTSFLPSPESEKTNDVTMELLEITGDTLHEITGIPLGQSGMVET